MRLGDLLEWLAAAALIAAAYRWHGVTLALVAGAVCLFYLAQCYDATLKRPRRRPKVDP